MVKAIASQLLLDSSEAAMDLQERMQFAITESELSHSRFAEVTGIGFYRISNMARGLIKKMRPEEAAAISEKFGYSEEWLRKGVGPIRKHDTTQQTEMDDAAEAEYVSLFASLLAFEKAVVVGLMKSFICARGGDNR